ncbi:MAG: hypothetical protein ACK4HE_03805 [Chitinophagaceae bacterium]
MEPNQNISTNEIQALSPTVAGLPHDMPYQVPHDYFNTLPQRTLLQVSLQATPEAYQIPPAYFEQLPNNILQQLRKAAVKEELASISPFLAQLPNTTPLQVPTNYFVQLQAKTSALNSASQGKLMNMQRIRTLYMAAAAAVVASLVTIGLQLQPMHSHQQAAHTLSDDEIVYFLDAQGSVANIAASAVDEYSSNNDNFFELLTDEELEQYLTVNGSSASSSKKS